MEDERRETPPPKPIRPFLTGLAIAAGWGAFNMPDDLTAGAFGAFAATIAAITLVTGGGCAMLVEAVKLAVRSVRTRLRR